MKRTMDLLLFCSIIIGVFGSLFYYLHYLKTESEHELDAACKRAEADRKREPEFELEKVDDLENLIFFTFGGKKHQFQSQIEKPEQYVWRDFTLKVRDFYENDVFKKIDFRLFKGDEQIAVLHPKIDYHLW
jgi:hypothetical protein